MIDCFKKFLLLCIAAISVVGVPAYAQTINIDASKLVQKVEVFVAPRSGSFVEGSTFEVPILINTKGVSVNGVEIRISFDKDKLSIIKPSGGVSIVGVWIEPPSYDNTRGTVSYVGVIPNGIVTESGLIGAITFKAKQTGKATISFASNSKVLLNNSLGTEARVDFGRADYDILPKPPEGVVIFSDTHPFQNEWYNNNSPVVFWEKDSGVEGFSYTFDHLPVTIPDNIVNITETHKSFEDLAPGLWYFHIKAKRNGVWGSTGHFLIRIDVNPPAAFNPEVNHVLATPVFVDRALVSFETTDDLSGVHHYEVGVIDKSKSTSISPVFVYAESPFQVPNEGIDKVRVIVRAVDNAGNVRDAPLDIESPLIIKKFIKDYAVYILLFIIIVGFVTLVMHYLFGHHIIRNIQRFRQIIKKEEQSQEHTEQQNGPNPPGLA